MYRVLESRLPKGISRIRPRADSLCSWSVEQNTRDTQMNTRMTEGESFTRGGSSLRSNPFIEEWCPFRIPTNSKSSYHFFVAIRCIEVFKKTTLINTLMIIFSTLSYTSTHKIPTLLDMLSLKKVPFRAEPFI